MGHHFAPKEEAQEEQEDAAGTADIQMPLQQVTQKPLSNRNLPLDQQFMSKRRPFFKDEDDKSEKEEPEEETEEHEKEEESDDEEERSDEEEERSDEEEEESDEEERSEEEERSDEEVEEVADKAEIVAVQYSSENNESEESTRWMQKPGFDSNEPFNSPETSRASTRELHQVPFEQPLQLLPKDHQPVPHSLRKQVLKTDERLPELPIRSSYDTMAALAETCHFDSDDSSEDGTDEEEELGGDIQASSKGASWKHLVQNNASSFSSEQPHSLPLRKPHQLSHVPQPTVPNASPGAIATSVMVQASRGRRVDSIEKDVSDDFVTIIAPPGPLGLILDGGVLDRAVVLGFAELHGGSNELLGHDGDVVHGSVLVGVNGEDVSRLSLHEVSTKLDELVQQTRTLVFRLPARKQQEGSRSPAMQRFPMFPTFEEDIDKRRKLELALVMHYDKPVLTRHECWFCIDAKWMARWVSFVARGGPEPGLITNETLLHSNWRKMLAHDAPGRPDTPRDGLILLRDYRVVSPMVWCLLAELHGQDEAPLFARYPKDIYAEALSDGTLSDILEVPRPKATVLAKDLRDKCLVCLSNTR